MKAFSPSCVLVTGGAGFIGSNFVRWLLANSPTAQVVCYDALTYAGNLESLQDVAEQHGPSGDGRYYFVHGDIRDMEGLRRLLKGEERETTAREAPQRAVPLPDAIVHMAAESHVDRSITGPSPFVETNVHGTFRLLEACRSELLTTGRVLRVLVVSTDEVYGSLGPLDPPFTEETPVAPRSPYAATKAGADLLTLSYVETFDLPALISRCSNNYGPYQFPEKLIPLMVTRALADQPLPVYGDGLNVRDWLHVEDHSMALWSILCEGELGRVYNVGGGAELTNLDVVNRVLCILEKPSSLIRFVSDRPGHDRRYAMNAHRLQSELGWKPRHRFDDGLAETVEWYLGHRQWWQRVLAEAYRTTNELYLKSD